MFLQVGVVEGYCAAFVNRRKEEIVFLRFDQNCGAIFPTDKFTFVIEELQCVPFPGIMACGDNDSASCFFPNNGEFNSGCSGKSEINNIKPKWCECAGDQVAHGFTADTCITPDNYLSSCIFFFYPGAVGSRKFYNIRWSKIFTRLSSNSSPDSWNTLNQWHRCDGLKCNFCKNKELHARKGAG